MRIIKKGWNKKNILIFSIFLLFFFVNVKFISSQDTLNLKLEYHNDDPFDQDIPYGNNRYQFNKYDGDWHYCDTLDPNLVSATCGLFKLGEGHQSTWKEFGIGMACNGKKQYTWSDPVKDTGGSCIDGEKFKGEFYVFIPKAKTVHFKLRHDDFVELYLNGNKINNPNSRTVYSSFYDLSVDFTLGWNRFRWEYEEREKADYFYLKTVDESGKDVPYWNYFYAVDSRDPTYHPVNQIHLNEGSISGYCFDKFDNDGDGLIDDDDPGCKKTCLQLNGEWCSEGQRCEGTDITNKAKDKNTHQNQICCSPKNQGKCVTPSTLCGQDLTGTYPDDIPNAECIGTEQIIGKINCYDVCGFNRVVVIVTEGCLTDECCCCKEGYEWTGTECSLGGITPPTDTCEDLGGEWCELGEICNVSTNEYTDQATDDPPTEGQKCCLIGTCTQIEPCPDAQQGTTNAGCHPVPPGLPSGATSNSKYCDNNEVCFDCKSGLHWDNTEQNCIPSKIDWEGNRGICKEENECYCEKNICSQGDFDEGKASRSEEPESNQLGWCVDPDQYKENHYCENGIWTTRTKFLAQAVLDAAPYSNYVFYCDEINNYQTCILKSDHNLIIGALLAKDEKATDSSYFNEFFGKNTGMVENYQTQGEGTHFKDLYYGLGLENNINTIVGYDETKDIVIFSNDKNTYISVGYPSFLNKFNRIRSSIQDNNKYFFLKNYGKEVQVVNRISDLVGYYDGQNVHTTTFAQRDTYWNKLKVFSTNKDCMDKSYSFKQTPITIENEFLPNEELITEGCCKADKCWNGKTCTDDTASETIKGNNYICADGQWIISKTAIIAKRLLKFAEDNNKNYVLHCEEYEKVIREPSGITFDNYEQYACVLKYDITTDNYEVAVGMPIQGTIDFTKLKLYNYNCNNVGENEKDFKRCKDNKVWKNPIINSYIFDKNGIALSGTISLPIIWSWIKGFINNLFGVEPDTLDSINLYHSKINNKEIKGFKKESNEFSIEYTGFGFGCDLFSGVTCTLNPLKVEGIGENKWKEYTVKIRLQNE